MATMVMGPIDVDPTDMGLIIIMALPDRITTVVHLDPITMVVPSDLITMVVPSDPTMAHLDRDMAPSWICAPPTLKPHGPHHS